MGNNLVTSVSYISTARADLNSSDFENILKSANLRNEKLALTGLLVFNGLNFMQLFEGQREAVMDCLTIIEEDRRHNGLLVFDRQESLHREFSNWHMAGALIDPKQRGIQPKLSDILAGPSVTRQTKLHFESFCSFGRHAT